MLKFKKVNTKIFAKSGPEATPDNAYWKNYGAPSLIKEFGAIDYISFSPTEPYSFAATCSCRVQIYNPTTKLVIKNLSRFKKVAYGGCFRKDGRLICAGGDEAIVKLFDVSTRSMLRSFIGHGAPVHRCFFLADGMRIVSFSDDKTTAVWDISSETKLVSSEEHNDYVRAGAVSSLSPDIYLSGGYDKIVNMYDVRVERKVMSVNHDAPVESILFSPSGGIFLSAGGTEIRVWDCLSNGRLLAKIRQHHKTITCLEMATNGRRILSGSLDQQIKIYDSGTYKTVHTIDYANPILSMGISADDSVIVAGMVNGMISVTQKEDFDNKRSTHKKISFQYMGNSLHSLHVDLTVNPEVKNVMGKHDICLRKFLYSKAVDHVMVSYVTNRSPHITIAVFQELIRRHGIIQALAGRNGKSLSNILKFIIRYISNTRFNKILVHITNVLIDIYEDKLEELNSESQCMFQLLRKKLEEEEESIISLAELQGSFRVILSAAESLTIPVMKYSCNLIPLTQKDLM